MTTNETNEIIAGVGDNLADVQVDDNPREKKLSFAVALGRMVAHTSNSMAYARYCAELAIIHFEKSGDLCHCQSMHDAMAKNYVRRSAFVTWLQEHAPVLIENKKFSKDKHVNAAEFNTKSALAKPFWEFVPEKKVEPIIFGIDNIIDGLIKALDKLDDKKHKPRDAATKKMQKLARSTVEALRTESNINSISVPNDLSVPSAAAEYDTSKVAA